MKFKIAFLVVWSYVAFGWQIGVEIEPLEARFAGALWRVAGNQGEWHFSGEKIDCEDSECTIEYKGIAGWQEPRPWKLKRPAVGNTFLNVSYERLPDRYTIMDFQLLIKGGEMERLLHLVTGLGCSAGYSATEDVSIGMVFEEDSWLSCDNYALQWDSRPFEEEVTWNLSVLGCNLLASWDSMLLPEGCEMRLIGAGMDLRMNQLESVELQPGEYVICVTFPGLVKSEHSLHPGWNLVPCNLMLEEGYHLLLKEMKAISLHPDSQSYSFGNGMKEAFWLFSKSATILELNGWHAAPLESESSGWRLVTVDEHTLLPENCRAWKYVNGRYLETKEMLPENAYWLLTP